MKGGGAAKHRHRVPTRAAKSMSSEASEVHRAIVAHVGSSLRVQSSELKPLLSLHVMPQTVPLSHVYTFQKIAVSCGKAGMSTMGSVDGRIIFSVNARPPPRPLSESATATLATRRRSALAPE